MKRITKLSNVLIAALLTCCIEPIDFDRPPSTSQLVVDGFISNQPGPYSVSLSRSRSPLGNQVVRIPVSGATITIHSNTGELETLVESAPGIYTTAQIQGVVGRSYWITIEMNNGARYESEPEMIREPGTVDVIQYEYEHRTKIVDGGIETNDDRFNVFIDATSSPETENYYRWKVTGTYKIETKPELITSANPDGFGRIPDPPPCSGWAVRNGSLDKVGLCTCCICWVTNNESSPQVSDDEFVEGNKFRHVRVGTVPISPETFYDKYHVSISQMALTKKTFNFFRLIKAQKEAVTSLFQPASGKLRGNITRTDAPEEVLGIFYAAGESTRSIFIDRYTLPVYPGALQDILLDCTKLKNSTSHKPSFWQ